MAYRVGEASCGERDLLSGGAAEHIHFEETACDINKTSEETDCSWAHFPNFFFSEQASLILLYLCKVESFSCLHS